MPKYRYYTADLLTGNVLGDVELYGVHVSKKISEGGNFNGSFALNSGKPALNDMYLSCTQPGRTALYMERNDSLIWGGILWSRTYSAQGQNMQLYAQTFDSYFEHVVFQEHFIQQRVNQEVIFKAMVDQLQAQSACNIGLEVQTPLPTTNTPRTILVPNYEYHFARETLDALLTEDQGLEMIIDVLPTATPDHPKKLIRLGFPLGSDNPALSYDYPGTIYNYWMPESGANGGVKFATLGFGSGNKIARATYVDRDAIAAGYPAWWRVDNYSTIADVGILADKAAANGHTHAMPYRTPTFELRSDVGVGFTGWNNVGDTFKIHIEDVRFPNGFDITSRMIGWEFDPQSGEGPEILKFAIDGAEM